MRSILLVILTAIFTSIPRMSLAQAGTPIECGDIIEAQFMAPYSPHLYSIALNSNDFIKIEVVRAGSYLDSALELHTPADTVLLDTGVTTTSGQPYGYAGYFNPVINAEGVPLTGIYTIFHANGQQDGNSVGEYTMYISCILDGIEIPAGSNIVAPANLPTVVPAPDLTLFGFPGLAPVDFGLAMTTALQIGTPVSGRIPPGVGAIFGYTFNGNTGDEIEMVFRRTGGNLNLSIVVLSADNQVIFQASLTQGDTLSTRFTLPTTGEYIIGVSEISLIPPASPEPTSFEITTSVN